MQTTRKNKSNYYGKIISTIVEVRIANEEFMTRK